MKGKKRSSARGLWLAIVGTVLGVALVLSPLSGRGAGPNDKKAAPGAAIDDAAPAAVGKGAKKAVKLATSAKEEAEAPERPDATPETPETPAAPPPPAEDLRTIPIGQGLPVRVSVAVFFLEVASFDDTKGEFEATTDVRLRWTDPRLAYPGKTTLRGYRQSIGKAAEEHLATMWSPSVDVQNRLEAGPYVGRRLRIFPNGSVESITRYTGKYKVPVDPEAFPFDRQRLALDLIIRDETVDELSLRFEKEDVEFSRAAESAKLGGWDIGLVDLKAGTVAGWNGDRYATAKATLAIDRQPGSSIASVFIPLIASLLIPLLALWMNKTDEEGFAVDAFELANMGIGGLFSVIALSFAIYSSNPIIASSDNTVTRLFGLNYAALAIALTIVVTFFRFELPRRWFGFHVQQEAFHFLSWAIPLLSLATATAFLCVAAA